MQPFIENDKIPPLEVLGHLKNEAWNLAAKWRKILSITEVTGKLWKLQNIFSHWSKCKRIPAPKGKLRKVEKEIIDTVLKNKKI